MVYMKKKYFRPNCLVVHIASHSILADSIPINEDEHDNVSGDAKTGGTTWWYEDEDN